MFCLPKLSTDNLLAALKDGRLNPKKLIDMTSSERREFLGNIVGKENAREVNAQLEAKIILTYQKKGMVSVLKRLTGITEATRNDMIAKIGRMDKILNPKTENTFLHDLVAKKLGTDVTVEQAARITELSKQVQEAQDDLKKDPGNTEKQIAYGNKYLDVIDYTESLKPQPKIWTLTNILNIPKSLLTSIFHFSASFVQGWGMMSTRPFWEAFGQQFKYFASEKNYRDLQASIISHPDYPLALKGKLGLTKLGDKLSSREEAIQSSLLEHIPAAKVLVRASSRAFTGFLNYTRFHRFTDLINAARLSGEDVRPDSQVVRDIAKTVNDFTGRGALGKDDRYGNAAPALNMGIFSPRKFSATIQMFNPQRYLDPRISATARMGALRQLSGSIIATGAILELAHLAGASVNLNPTSTDFLKIRFGNTTIDLTGSNATYLRMWARVISGKSTSASGKSSQLSTGKFGSTTREDEVISFFRNKLSPVAAMVSDFLVGKDGGGNPTTVQGELYDKFVPLVMQDFINLTLNDSKNVPAWVMSLFAVFGADEQSEKPK